ncbi:MAG: enoyl-CoA hydratase-related protein [Bdellovibrionota bacterium]
MMFENFLVEEQGSIVIAKLNRPKALNALNSQTLVEFSKLLTQLSSQGGITALVVTGAGEKAFIAGADISEMSTMSADQALGFARKGQQVTMQLESFPAPVIAAVNGFALGGGCEMALACDFIIASRNAVFGQPEVALGLITGFGGAVRLAEYVGWPMARELIYSGRRIPAEEALRVGLVNRVVEQEKLLEEALVIAKEISANSPAAVRKVKWAMNRIRSESQVASKLEIEAKAFSETFNTFDQREGTKAFAEKRKPQFKGE